LYQPLGGDNTQVGLTHRNRYSPSHFGNRNSGNLNAFLGLTPLRPGREGQNRNIEE
jgi:hypothetical protein